MNRSTSDDGRSELDGIDLPSSAATYGVDADGAIHYHDAVTHQVWVVADGELVAHYETVATIDDWHDYVADRRGWDETYYSEGGFAETLVDLVEEAIEGGCEEVRA